MRDVCFEILLAWAFMNSDHLSSKGDEALMCRNFRMTILLQKQEKRTWRKNTLGQNHTFCPKIHLNFILEKIWLFLKMRFWKCKFCEKCDFENVIFVKNVILNMWIWLKNEILKMWFLWKCDFENAAFVKKCEFKYVNFANFENVNFLKHLTWTC